MAKIDISKYNLDVRNAAHAIGLGYSNPYIRHGKMYYKPYRNRFYAAPGGADFDSWKYMKRLGHADCVITQGGTITSYNFWLTRKGLDWLGKKLNIHIYDEEE